MKNRISEIDELIKETLSEEEARFYTELDEQGPIEMLGGLFRGKNRWILLIMNVVMFCFLIAFVYCLMKFLDATETNELIKWGAGGMVSLLTVSMLKLFAWLQMDKNALLREIKRLEIQVASIGAKLSN